MIDYNMTDPMDAFFRTAGGLQTLQSNQQNMQQQQQENQYVNQQRQEKQQSQERMAAAQQKASEAIKTGMPAAELAAFSMENPEVGELLKKNLGLISADKEQKYIQTTQAILANPNDVENILKDGFDMVPDSGDEGISAKAIAKYRENPTEFLDGIEKTYSMLSPAGYKSYLTTRPETMTDFQAADLSIKRENTKLRALEAEARRAEQGLKTETNELKRQELQSKVEQARLKVDDQKQKLKQASTGIESARNGIINEGQQVLSLLDEIEQSPGFSSAVGAKGISSGYGAFETPVAGTDAADVAAKLDTLGAKNFLTSIKSFKEAGGAGALSDAEGKKLSAAMTNLSRDQTEASLKKNLATVREIVGKQIQQAQSQSKAPAAAESGNAPDSAIQYLKQNPNLKAAFKAKYGYLPEGV
jgi:hypothetical protein